ACKLGPEVLDQAISVLPVMTDPNLLVGMDKPDDAGVYRLSDDLALIQTLDFFTPVVDDPYLFGQIAVTNALSDVYAMGGRPLLAMNIICFPQEGDVSILQEILRGGYDKMIEAGVLLVGGHSVDDSEIKYGISVTGTIHPDKVLKNIGSRPGDRIILTKPVGTGIISTAIKADLADAALEEKVAAYMNTLNKIPAELMAGFDIHACTDVTGFGLLGHACEMIEGSDVGMTIHASQVLVIQEAVEFAAMGLIPAGAYRNEKYRQSLVDIQGDVSDDIMKILSDPQTSGGLLISLPSDQADRLLGMLHDAGITEAAIVGEITPGPAGRILITP
ncbi:MAG TPA: selenide, water dikinase SelD, partial [Deltaproteobacteria bacterium]|nr:selenide, water dikinase SelD [Deltaproteobacteria bacterium]